MQKQQVFKVKGMQRDLSMPNANGEFAYEIVNMRLMPAEDLSGFSLTNEKGTLATGITLDGQVIGQCPTNDSLVVFTTNATYNENDERTGGFDYIYEIYQTPEGRWTTDSLPLYKGDLNFHADKHIEALFNYETEDIQKVYWIDGINQLRCINLVGEIQEGNNQQFDSVKEINSLPSVEIERVAGGSFTAGVIQYYITYFNKNSSESPIVYTSPLLYIAHDNRGANANDQVSTAFKLTFTDLDAANWEYMRIYATHRTSIDATPEASIITELNMDNSTIEFTDYGSNRTSIAPTDLYFTGGKFVKAGTMTVKDQVMFLGNLNIETPETVSIVEIQHLFDSIRNNEDHPFTTTTRKTKENKLEEYEDTYYYYKNQLNNIGSITHYKYGEKYRFGISVLDKYGNWSNPIWIKDAFIEVPPEQVDKATLELPCPSLKLYSYVTYNGETKTLLEHLQDRGAISIKPLVVFPKEDERKVVAQGVVCPTVYNLKDRKENGPYAQASWFMRPNLPGDLWGFSKDWYNGDYNTDGSGNIYEVDDITNSRNWINHRADVMRTYYEDREVSYSNTNNHNMAGLFDFSRLDTGEESNTTAIDEYIKTRSYLLYDDIMLDISYQPAVDTSMWARGRILKVKYHKDNNRYLYEATGEGVQFTFPDNFLDPTFPIHNKGSWVEFRHNYALRTKGWFSGRVYRKATRDLPQAQLHPRWVLGTDDVQGSYYSTFSYKDKPSYSVFNFLYGGFRGAELGVSNFQRTIPVNRFLDPTLSKWGNISLDEFNTSTSAFYVDNSIITLNSPEIEFGTETEFNADDSNSTFRIVGMIPLTATISDSSLLLKNNGYDPKVFGNNKYVKISTQNKNIGYLGFRGEVAAGSFYGSTVDKIGDNNDGNMDSPLTTIIPSAYTTTPVYPWNSTGRITGFPSDWEELKTKTNYSELDKKRLSNLRYSASSFYFSDITISEPKNRVYATNGLTTGWKPANGCIVTKFIESENKIIKINNCRDGLDVVYKGNISDTIANLAGGPAASTPFKNYYYFAGGQSVSQNTLDDPEKGGWPSSTPLEVLAKGFSIGNKDKYLEGVGAGISYKSSPHYVISFNLVNSVWKWNKENKELKSLVQETLPALGPYNNEGYSELTTIYDENSISPLVEVGRVYESENIGSLYHQAILDIGKSSVGLPSFSAQPVNNIELYPSNYGWLWLGEIYRETDPTFGGTSDWALQNNQWEIGGKSGYDMVIDTTQENLHNWTPDIYNGQTKMEYSELEWSFGEIFVSMSNDGLDYLIDIPAKSIQILKKHIQSNAISSIVQLPISTFVARDGNDEFKASDILIDTRIYKSENKYGIVFLNLPESYIGEVDITDIHYEDWFFTPSITWTQGDTYYQRFDTLKTYAYSDSDQNSVIDITSFMVETRINIDGRTDRNRGQESNLQMSPTNFNLMNDVYSQRDNFFTYRILDKDLQARTNFPNQITWSLTKTAGATVDAWMNITLASVLDLDGTKGELTALKTFNNHIIALQESGVSEILFNSRVQIPTSESVPIQIANSGKVDGQQYFTNKLGCQDKWTIVDTTTGLYWVDYDNKVIYKFNGQVEDLSTPKGFRGWCDKNITSSSQIRGYYDKKNKEVMFYDANFSSVNNLPTSWLGFSELTNTFSSFYTYPEARLVSIKDTGLWLYGNQIYEHQKGEYNHLLDGYHSYGLTDIVRQDSNLVKTFNNVEFRADTYLKDLEMPEERKTFDTIHIEDEYNGPTSAPLKFDPYRPSNLKKYLRTWRANIPRVNNEYKRYVNQWAKVGLWMTKPSSEKTILHDMAVWYSE